MKSVILLDFIDSNLMHSIQHLLILELNLKLNQTRNMHKLNLIAAALEFAAFKHRDQRRKDQVASPYINHPISIMNILINEAQIEDPNVIIAALLHDTIEDTETTPEEIEKHFGSFICKIVEEVTDNKNHSRSERKSQQIEHAPYLSSEAAMVKIADKISNLRDITKSPPTHWSSERKIEYREWAQKVVKNIRNPHPKLLIIFEQTISDSK